MIKLYEYSARAELSTDAEEVYPLFEAMTYHKVDKALKEQYSEMGTFELMNKTSEIGITYNTVSCGFMDIECIAHYKTPLTIDEMRYIFETVDDTHVMIESINYSDKFNGNRYYDYENSYNISDEFKQLVKQVRQVI